MKFTTVFSTILAAASSLVNAAGDDKEFAFSLPNAVGGPGPAGALLVNLTTVTSTARAMSAKNISIHDVSDQYSRALTDMFDQIPQYVDTIQTIFIDCNEQCCEDACMILIWIPGAAMLCIELCKIKYGYA